MSACTLSILDLLGLIDLDTAGADNQKTNIEGHVETNMEGRKLDTVQVIQFQQFPLGTVPSFTFHAFLCSMMFNVYPKNATFQSRPYFEGRQLGKTHLKLACNKAPSGAKSVGTSQGISQHAGPPFRPTVS